MQALPTYNAGDFAAFLHTPQTFVLDLSNASILEVIEELCKMKNVVNPKSYKQYSCLKNQLRGLQEAFNVTIMPTQVTDIFWNHFIAYMINVSKLAVSTVKTVCARLRAVLSWASRHNCKVSPSFDFVDLPSYCHQQVALTPDEVSHIYHFDIDSIPRRKQYRENMERVRDMFVLSCNLGQRFSDMVRIDKTCFDRNIFTILQQKTGSHARVDIERMSLDRNTTYAILEKYNYKAPITGDISAHDRYIKQLLQYIGQEFFEPVKQEQRINGVIETKLLPKYKLISSHTCRRTFATVNVLKGMSEAEVRRGTGHKSSSAFEKYLCYYDN